MFGSKYLKSDFGNERINSESVLQNYVNENYKNGYIRIK